jgi:hypothetical protein
MSFSVALKRSSESSVSASRAASRNFSTWDFFFAMTTSKSNAADIFLHGCRFCAAIKHLGKDHTETTAKVFSGPIMIMSAFTIEVFIKCLINIETGRTAPRDHKLRTLFDLLSKSTQDRIEHRWDTEIVPLRRTFWDNAEVLEGKKIDRSLRGALDAGSDGFVQMRYRYELELGRKAHFWLTDLPIALHRVILEIKPEWQNLNWDHQTLPTSLIR